MLLTTCPSCSAQFRVQPEQLNVRQGRVMCGRCRNVFNAFETLKRIEENEEMLRQTPSPSTATAYPESADPVLEAAAVAELDTMVSRAIQNAVIPTPSTQAAQAMPTLTSIEDVPAFTSQTEAVSAEGQPFHLAAETLEPDGHHERVDALSVSNNPLLRASNKTNRPPRRAIWIIGIMFLTVVLAMQATYYFRVRIVELYPQARPYLVKACEIAKCTMSWSRNEAAIKIETSDLIESPVNPGRILLTATVVNRSRMKQELPAIELRLTDNGNLVLTSRILQPGDYLGRAPLAEEGLAPGAELFISLNLEIANKTPASGYGLRAFYP